MLILNQYYDGNHQGAPIPITSMTATGVFQDGSVDDTSTYQTSFVFTSGTGNVLNAATDLGATIPAITTVTAMVDCTEAALFYSDDGATWLVDQRNTGLTGGSFQKVTFTVINTGHRYYDVSAITPAVATRISDVRFYNGSVLLGNPPRSRASVLIY